MCQCSGITKTSLREVGTKRSVVNHIDIMDCKFPVLIWPRGWAEFYFSCQLQKELNLHHDQQFMQLTLLHVNPDFRGSFLQLKKHLADAAEPA